MNEEILQYFQLLLQYAATEGASLNEESQEVLAQLIAQFVEIIEQRNGEAPPEPPEEPDFTQSMPSSNIEGFSYDDKTGQMYVRFLGKYPNRNGPIYQYNNVPQNIFEIFRNGAIPAKTNGRNKWGRWWEGKYPSMGAAMYHLIRAAGYPYQRVA